MLKNSLKTALRFLKQNRVFAGINALGLSIALAASFIILLYVINELSYNRLHKNRKYVYRVNNYYKDFKMTMAGTPYILSSALKDEFPQIERAVNTNRVDLKLKLKDEFIKVRYSIATNSDIFDIFTIPLIYGSSGQNMLEEQNSVVLSEDLAGRFFPDQNPVGKEITGLINNEEYLFVVQGVFKDIPENSTFTAQCLINSKWTIDPINKAFNIANAESNWSMDFWDTWIRLSKNCNPKLLEEQFDAFEIKNIGEQPHNHYTLQNLQDVYLHSDNVMNSGIQGNISNIRLFSTIAFLIILVASINYVILSTAVSAGRSKEIGIRKTLGAGNRIIRNQLLSESVILALVVLPVSLIMMWLGKPYAEKLFQSQLNIINSNIPIYIFIYLSLTVIIGILSGIYTSGFLSRLKVIDILKNKPVAGKKRYLLRSALIVVQLIIFCSLISCALFIRSQYKFALNREPGYFNKDILLVDLGRNFDGYSSFINNIKSNPNIISAAGTMYSIPMMSSMSTMVPHFQEKDKKVKIEGMAVDYGFISAMGIKILEGRDFSEDYGSDLHQSCILNETAVKALGITDPVGKKIESSTIIGIVKDFNLHSVHSEIPPVNIHMTNKYIHQVAIHYKPGTLTGILTFVEDEWKKAAPDKPFSFQTIEDLVKEIYSSERNLTSIVSIFGLFTLIIASTGLFGLTLFVSRSRMKEIGIKKVFGSSERSIVFSFLSENFIMVSVAAIISVPVTIYFIKKWLDNFAYKTNIDGSAFIITYLFAVVIVLVTVLFHSLKASRTNPVLALRYE
jgi:putative ABC transport system permease protein